MRIDWKMKVCCNLFSVNFILCIFIAAQIWAHPQFTREEYEEDVEDVYDEVEEKTTTTKRTSYLKNHGQNGKLPSFSKRPTSAQNWTPFTKQEWNDTESALGSQIQANIVASDNNASPSTLVITVPHGAGGELGQTITINIPIPMASVRPNKTQHQSAEIPDLSNLDDQEVKKIESAIMEALLFANEMKTLNITSENGSSNFELDFGQIDQQPGEEQSATDSANNGISSGATDKPPRKRRRTTPVPLPPISGPDSADPLGIRPLTALIMSQVQNGKLPEFLMRAAWAFVRDGYALSAIQTIECIVIDLCEDF